MGLFGRLLSALGLGGREDADRGPRGESEAPSTAAEPEAEPRPEPRPEAEALAEDDHGSFDFERDIARFFTAEFRLEQALGNSERHERLLAEYQLRDAAHWTQVKASFERWLVSPIGRAKYPDDAALMQARMTTTQTVTVDELEAMIEGHRGRDSGA